MLEHSGWLKAVAMHAQLDEIRCISMPRGKRVWKVCRGHGDIIDCDGQQFVRVSPKSHTLSAVVNEPSQKHSKNAEPLPMKSSVGLAVLAKLRNEAHASKLNCTHRDAEPGASLFDVEPGQGEPAYKKQKRLSESRKLLKSQTTAMDVQIQVGGELKTIKVLQPVKESDGIFVEYDAESLWLLIQFLREQGFDEGQTMRARRDPGLPKGIFQRKDKYLVKYPKEDGSTGYKILDNLEEAVSFKANPQAFAEDDCGDVEADELDGDAPQEFVEQDSVQESDSFMSEQASSSGAPADQ
jgi:hypothetical protein